MAKTVQRGILAVRAETGAPTGAEVKALIEGVQTAFAQFKAEHTKQLEEIKANKSGADQEAKLQKINADLDRLQKETEDAHTKIASAQMGAGGKALRDKEYTDSFNAHMRKGDV
ncbi:phage major capsid protein, partial [Comamonas sp. SY3]